VVVGELAGVWGSTVIPFLSTAQLVLVQAPRKAMIRYSLAGTLTNRQVDTGTAIPAGQSRCFTITLLPGYPAAHTPAGSIGRRIESIA